MATLYIFAIGGSGSKVVESLTMLLAAGMKVRNYDELVPVLIDPDLINGNLNRTNDLLKNYEETGKQSNYEGLFFGTKIRPLVENSSEKYKYALEGLNATFGDFIAYDSLDNNGLGLAHNDKIKKLAGLLFSEKDNYLLNLDMEVGFKGYPNIGSVAFNKFAKSQAFREVFQNNVNSGDAVIFIGSIFGGTGAAGLPALLANIRKDPIPSKKNILNDMPVGVVSMLPYYSITDKTGNKIKSSHFFPKTKDALNYYKESVYKENVQSFYYIANDCDTGALPYSEGGATQKNPVFFAELVAALAILDFASDKHTAGVLKAKEFLEIRRQDDVENTNEDITFSEHSNLNEKTRLKIAEPLFQLLFLKKYMDYEFKNAKNDVQAWTELWNKDAGDSINFEYSGDFKAFLDRFEEYLKELGSYGHKFKPFDLDKKPHDLSGILKNINYDFDFEEYSKKLDILSKGKSFIKRPSYKNSYERLFKLIYNATSEMFNEIPGIAKEKK
ncbi:MAG: hypothetical protein LBC75_03825 [Fibromonadaceae bacterium]|jgi:hypothetical protein|nr:hypothetical protein [Fibromonadaceae bacterium]